MAHTLSDADGVRFCYDENRRLVSLMFGTYCLDQMTIHDFERTFGLMAAVDLTRK